MMNKYCVLTFLLSLTLASAIAQIENERNLQLSFYGDAIFSPGIQIGYQQPIKKWTKTKTKKNRTIIKNKSFSAGMDLAYYRHPHHHHGLILSPNISYQRIKHNGNYFQLKFNLGMHRSFVDGVTYSVNVNENVKTKKLAGQNTLYNAFTFDFGKDLRAKREIPIRYIFQFGINGRFPYNKSYLPGFQTGFGIHYFFQK